ncbi:proline dehydrogenase [Emydomyces testavorans]|uniref:Proline dehydrogenase n=1 Tax=Emydomyces testavorans TaxID=2070801 RepID=A0AAF0IGG6_9EURO|nr:proline dehydrogenase [Emydomyces testavorans]
MAYRLPTVCRASKLSFRANLSLIQSSQRVRPFHVPSESPENFPQTPWETTKSAAAAAAVALASPASPRVLGRMPTTSLFRSIMLQTVMSRPRIMDIASDMLRRNVQLLTGNAVLRFLLDNVFYAQFCAGRTESEIRRTVEGLRTMGYRGVILAYAREVELSDSMYQLGTAESEALHKSHVAQWLQGTLQTIKYAQRGDFVAVKYTGAGIGCVHALETGQTPDDLMADALEQICILAKKQGVKLLVDAEHYAQKAGIDSWTLDLMQRHNRDGQTVVYNTYQMYLKESMATLESHLEMAQRGRFNLGVKLVRGAYINSDPRHLIHDTKADTDRAFDDAARMLATQHIDKPLAPKIGLVLASHNKESTRKMRELRQEQLRRGLPLADVVYAQLMGMADELSMSLTQKTPDLEEEDNKVFKYVVWGTTEECMMYLLRRAEENRDAVERSSLSKQALWEEFRGRLASSLRLRRAM